jgi:hypothetical protein
MGEKIDLMYDTDSTKSHAVKTEKDVTEMFLFNTNDFIKKHFQINERY